MQLNYALLTIYPKINFETDVHLQNDGNGDYIAAWHYDQPQPTAQELIDAWNTWQAGELDRAKVVAIGIVKKWTIQQESALDSLIVGHYVRSIMLNTEIVGYYQAGRPTNPLPTVYVIANAMAVRRGILLREMLEILFAKWRNIQTEIARIVTDFDRLIEEIEAAVSVAEINTILQPIKI